MYLHTTCKYLIILMTLAGKHDDIVLFRMMYSPVDSLTPVNDSYVRGRLALQTYQNVVYDILRIFIPRVVGSDDKKSALSAAAAAIRLLFEASLFRHSRKGILPFRLHCSL